MLKLIFYIGRHQEEAGGGEEERTEDTRRRKEEGMFLDSKWSLLF
jgi:hypothetical protein